jgi:hypothetical protein
VHPALVKHGLPKLVPVAVPSEVHTPGAHPAVVKLVPSGLVRAAKTFSSRLVTPLIPLAASSTQHAPAPSLPVPPTVVTAPEATVMLVLRVPPWTKQRTSAVELDTVRLDP